MHDTRARRPACGQAAARSTAAASAAPPCRRRAFPCCSAFLAAITVACIALGRWRQAPPVRGPGDGQIGGSWRSTGSQLRSAALAGSPVATKLSPAPARKPQPQHKFLIFFSGHQGSSALADMLAAHPSVFVPGFEPLDFPGLSPAQKMAFLEATFSFPSPEDATGWNRWRDALLPPVPGLRVERHQVRAAAASGRLEGKTVAGFKLRPYPLEGVALPDLDGSGEAVYSEDATGGAAGKWAGRYAGPGSTSSSRDPAASAAASATAASNASSTAANARSAAADSSSKGHTAMSGLDPLAVRALLERHNVSVVLTLRRNTLKEALSWYKARELGQSQFTARRAGQAAVGSGRGAGDAHAAGTYSRSTTAAHAARDTLAVGQGEGTAGAAVEEDTVSSGSRNSTSAISNGKQRADVVSVLGWLRYAERVNAQLRQVAAFFGRSTVTVWYEDFLEDPLAVAEKTARFIGVPTAQLGAGVSEQGGSKGSRRGIERRGGGGGAPAGTLASASSAGLQLSSKFKKAGPDAIEDWLENYGELCAALEGTPHYQHLNAAACLKALGAAVQGGGSAAVRGGGSAAVRGVDYAAVQRGGSTGIAHTQQQQQQLQRQIGSQSQQQQAQQQQQQQPAQLKLQQLQQQHALSQPKQQPPVQPGDLLLDNWCTEADKEATGWAGLSDAACVRRVLALQEAAVAAVRNGSGTLLFKHVHKAGGSTLCQLAQRNMAAESPPLPFRTDWTTNCVPYEAFLGAHPAVGGGGGSSGSKPAAAGAAGAAGAGSAVSATRGGAGAQRAPPSPASGTAGTASSTNGGSATSRRCLQAHWLGGACWLGFLTPPQLRVLPHHFRPLTFVASEGPLPDAVPLDVPGLAWATMLRRPLDRVLSSYRWWQIMVQKWPQAPAECHAYAAPANATLAQWLEAYPDNWLVRELSGRTALYERQRPMGEADLLLAIKRLHLFSAVLLLEQPGSSMELMRRVFGWRDVGWEQHRAGSRHDSDALAELPPTLLRRLKERNELDQRLYRHAEALHAAQVRRWLGGDPGGAP